MKTSFLLLAILLSYSAFTQKPSVEFGEVSLTDFSGSSDAEAVVLYSGGYTTFEYRNGKFFIAQKVHRRIRILKKSALHLASVDVTYFQGLSSSDEVVVSQVKGCTYNVIDGKVQKEKLVKDMIFREKITDQYWKIKLALPQVREGSIIEYAYDISTPMTIDLNPRNWIFQENIPVNLSEYQIIIPNILLYRINLSGYIPLSFRDMKNTSTIFGSVNMSATAYRFAMANVPAFQTEDYITTPKDYLAQIDFELSSINWPGVLTEDYTTTYQDLNQTLLKAEDFGERYRLTYFVKDIAKSIALKSSDPIKQLQAVKDYLIDAVQGLGNDGIFVTDLKKVLNSKKGSSAELNFLYVSILKELGFDANPLIISTVKNGRLHKQHALLKEFNYVLVHVAHQGKDWLLDATNPNLPAHIIPTDCLSDRGWLVHPSQGRFISITPEWSEVEVANGDFSIQTDGEMTGNITFSFGGYAGAQIRNEIAQIGESKWKSDWSSQKPDWLLSELHVKQLEPIEKSVVIQGQSILEEGAQVLGRDLLFRPLLTEGYTLNPFPESKRIYPVDFSAPLEQTHLFHFTLPVGYRVVELPKPAAISTPDGFARYIFSLVEKDGKVTLNSRLVIRKKSFSPSEYGVLKAFFDQVLAKQKEQVVLQKID